MNLHILPSPPPPLPSLNRVQQPKKLTNTKERKNVENTFSRSVIHRKNNIQTEKNDNKRLTKLITVHRYSRFCDIFR